jgi:hypothetical protein
MSGTGMNRFETWEHSNLAKFCDDCSKELTEKDKEIIELRENLRAALDAYRSLVVENARKAN